MWLSADNGLSGFPLNYKTRELRFSKNPLSVTMANKRKNKSPIQYSFLPLFCKIRTTLRKKKKSPREGLGRLRRTDTLKEAREYYLLPSACLHVYPEEREDLGGTKKVSQKKNNCSSISLALVVNPRIFTLALLRNEDKECLLMGFRTN